MNEYALARVIYRKPFTLTQVTRVRSSDGHDFCIYKVTEVNEFSGSNLEHGYEVIRVLIRNETTFKDRKNNETFVPEHEAYPGDAMWGRCGFSYKTLAEAEAKLSSLLSSGTRDIQPVKTKRAQTPESTKQPTKVAKTRVYGGKKQ